MDIPSGLDSHSTMDLTGHIHCPWKINIASMEINILDGVGWLYPHSICQEIGGSSDLCNQ